MNMPIAINATVEERGTRPASSGINSNYEIIIHLTPNSAANRSFGIGQTDRIHAYSNILLPGSVTVANQATCLNIANLIALQITGKTVQ